MSARENTKLQPRAARKAPLLHDALSRLLVPTDFSNGAAHALRRAVQLPLHNAEIVLVHVLPPNLPGRLKPQATAEAKRRLRELVARVRRRMAARRVAVHGEVLSGEPFVEIVRHSRTLRSDLIVLGRHGVRRFRDLLIGTTAERVVRKGDVPVLIVGAAPHGPYQRPLIATDLGDTASRTFDLTMRLLEPSANRVTVAHAVHVPFEGFNTPALATGETSRYRRELHAIAKAGLEALVEPYTRRGIRCTQVLRIGDARQVVLAEAARRHVDLIALGTHGRTGLAHMLVGSIAESVVANAPCDVLIARPIRFTFTPP